MAGSKRTTHKAVQDIQKMYASSVALALKAAAELRSYMRYTDQFKNAGIDIEIPLEMIKDSLYIAGKVNQTINQFRRNLIRPSLPSRFAKLADVADETSEWLFGDSISERVEFLEKENKLNALLKTDRKSSVKRKFTEHQQSNSKSSSKTQKRTNENGQSFKPQHQNKPRQQQNLNNNSRQHNQSSKKPHHHQQKSSYTDKRR